MRHEDLSYTPASQKYHVVADDAPNDPIIANSATGAWTVIVRRANEIREREHSNSGELGPATDLKLSWYHVNPLLTRKPSTHYHFVSVWPRLLRIDTSNYSQDDPRSSKRGQVQKLCLARI